MKYIVYQTTNKVNGKLYIGVHKTETPDVFDGYVGNGIYVGYQIKNPKTAYQHALKKYGYNSFIRTTLKVFDTEEEAYAYEAQLVTLDFIKQDNNYNIKTGGIHGSWNFKTVYQFNYNGDLIKIWNSISDIIEHYSCNGARIRMAVTNKYSAFESFWNFENNIDIKEYRKSNQCELYQFSKNGELIKVFRSTTQAAKELQYNLGTLNEAVSKKKCYKNCYWTKDPDNIFNIIKINKLYNLRNKSIVQYDINMHPINEFDNVKQLSNEIGITPRAISKAIQTNSLVNDKYYFKYNCIVEKQKVAQYDYKTGELIKIWDSISECAKEHPKCRDVIKGGRNQTHGYTFKYYNNDIV